MPDERNSQKIILDILDYAKDGLEFLKKSDETDFQKKIEDSGIQFLTSEEIKLMHQSIGFTEDALVRPSLLESAVQRPVNIFLYKDETSIPLLAAEICYSIVQNHPFFDGNKRVALISLYYFLEKNSFPKPDDPLRLAAMILQLAQHKIKTESIYEYLVSKNDIAARPAY